MLSVEQIKAIGETRRQEARTEKAESYQARLAAEEAHGWYELLKNHSGQNGLKNGVFHDCIANKKLLEQWISETYTPPIIDADSLETAFSACRERLAQPPSEQYVRRADVTKSIAVEQLQGRPPEEIVLPYTNHEILSWSKERLRKEMEKSPQHVTALNRILAGK